jgi:hypothetical protein
MPVIEFIEHARQFPPEALRDQSGLAQGPSAHAGGLSAHRNLSARGALRLNGATAPIIVLNRRELAEGCGRDGDAELARFCSIAMGSASELEYHLLLAKDLKLLTATDHTALTDQATEVKRMLTGLHQKLTLIADS